MTRNWEPGTQYNQGDVVSYHGNRYKIIQPHSSQGDWTPDRTPALWGRLEGNDHGGHHDHGHGGNNNNNNHSGGNNNQYQPPPPGYNQGQAPHPQQQQPPPSTYGQGDQKVQPTEEQKQKKWYDLDDEDKKKMEVGGGLLAGAALLGGGYLAWKHHKEDQEDQKAQTWALSNWARDAQARRDDFDRNGLRGPAQWVLNKGKSIPQSAIVVSKEKDWNLYICRAFYEGGIQVGKASDSFTKGAVIGYDDDEIHLDTYEILVGDMRGLRWVDTSGPVNVQNLGARPVEGGREADGTPIYIASAFHKDAVHPGKCTEKMKGANIPYGGKEKSIAQYRVLCYN